MVGNSLGWSIASEAKSCLSSLRDEMHQGLKEALS